MSTPVGRVSVANPEIAEIKVITPQQIQIIAAGIGETHLSAWDRNDRVSMIALKITRNVATLRAQLKELFPGEEIEVTSAGDLVILSGEVSDVRLPQRATEVASLHASRVANLIRVRGNQQAQLEVRFAEVSRSSLREMGTNFFHSSPFQRVGGLFSAETVPGSVIPGFPLNVPPLVSGTGHPTNGLPSHIPQAPFTNAFNLFFSNVPGFGFSAILSLLEQNGLAKVLAEPTLVAMSGQEAKFLAGGEIPIPVQGSLGQLSLTYKSFGIQLGFTPTVLADDTVHLKLLSEVSEVDLGNSVQFAGFTFPGFSTRRSETTIRLRDGQSFAVAGLLSDRTRSILKKMPLFGDLPIIGMLFRSTNFLREETELLVVVTIRLVQPLAPHQVPPMPGESEVNDPDDFELFILGRTTRVWGESGADRQRPLESSRTKGGPAGEVGFGR
jgi:pilus assembly protein CpaC